MASTINSTDTGQGGLITTGDSSDELQLQTAETTAITITSGQQSAFIAGTASAPAVTTTGDLNTGIFFPAGDAVGVATNGAEAARFNSSGNLVFPNGQGIDFSASAGGGASSSLLDDYEEGTWTPTVAFGGASVGVTYSDQTGFYTKVGNLVYATCRIVLSSKGTSTGSFSVKSFPFTSVNIVSYRSGGSWAFWSALATSYVEIAIYMQNNYNFVEFYGATAAATGLSQISDTSIQNNTNIQFTIVYQAA